jgi:flavin-dependent dehydrogenase
MDTGGEIYDLAIIGLGPAGSTLTRLLDPGLKVVCLDKKQGFANFLCRELAVSSMKTARTV